MKHRHLAIVGGGVLIMTHSASAAYAGLILTTQAATGGRFAYRVYAVCTDPNDYITAVSGSPSLGNLVILSRNIFDTAPGSNFFNPLGGGATAPSNYAIGQNADIASDTFVTIGVSRSDHGSGPVATPDQTGLSPGFGGIGTVTLVNSNNAGWFTPGPVEQGRAGYLGDGDPSLRVLLMQLTVSSTTGVKGTVAISGVNNIGLAGGQAFTASGQTFHFIPGPGAISLLGLAFVSATRRRIR